MKTVCVDAQVPFLLPEKDFHRTTVAMQSRILPALIPADLVEIFRALQGADADQNEAIEFLTEDSKGNLPAE